MSLHDKKFQVTVLSVVSTIHTIEKTKEEIENIGEEKLIRHIAIEAHEQVKRYLERDCRDHNVLHSGVQSVKSIVKKEEFLDKDIDEEFGDFLAKNLHDTSELDYNRDCYPKTLLNKLP